MVRADDIRDRESLREWLEGRPREECVLIAVRAACRVAPLGWARPATDRQRADLTTLPICRALLIASVAGQKLTPTIRQLAYASADSVYDAANSAKAATYASANAAAFAIDAPTYVDDAVANIGEAAAQAAEAAARSGHTAVLWQEVREDARALEAGTSLSIQALWSVPEPDDFRFAFGRFRSNWEADPAFSFWLRWWDGVVSGRPLPWDLQEKVALIAPEVWDQGAAAVAAEIETFRKELAFAKTENAEHIEINPKTGRLRLVPDGALPDDIAVYARRKMGKALSLFDDAPANQYTGLSPALSVLRTALEDAANLPVELFDACASASRLVVALGRQGNCPSPEQDPLVQDFLTRVREAGADILANDPKTREVLERRNAIVGNDALIDGRKIIVQLAVEIAALSEGRLATALPDDAWVATDPNANPEERKVASVKIAGRLLRIGKLAFWIVGGTGGAIIGTQKVLEAIPAIAASSIYKMAVEYMMRWLGF